MAIRQLKDTCNSGLNSVKSHYGKKMIRALHLSEYKICYLCGYKAIKLSYQVRLETRGSSCGGSTQQTTKTAPSNGGWGHYQTFAVVSGIFNVIFFSPLQIDMDTCVIIDKIIMIV